MTRREFSREELFALVWEKPTSEIAKELGISDVALSKLCRRLQVPKPPRGYWAKVQIVLPAARSRHQNGARSELCQRFMAIPGVRPVTAPSFMTALDDLRASDIPAYFGQTSRRWQSGTSIDVQGRISKAGDADVRRSLTRRLRGLMARSKGSDKVKS